MLLTVIIPARDEEYLQKTIENVLENIEGDTEIIAIADGYWPNPIVKDHPRVNLIHHTEARGQRASINEAARIARGKYIMKLDAHCAVGKGFDVILAADCKPDWTVIPRMYNLDPETWKPKHFDNYETAVKMGKVHDYLYMEINNKNELRAKYYTGSYRRKLHLENKDKLIDDTMCCMGPGWFMEKERFWELEGCDEGHGGPCGWGQQGVEVSCKAWLSGGAMKVNKKTWFAHWFRGGGGPGFPYRILQKDIDNARDYSKDLWMNNKWHLQKRDFMWLIDKFNPPGWEDFEKRWEVNSYLYVHTHRRRHDLIYRGVKILKLPSDMFSYHKAIWETRPDYIVEIGTKFGGSALFLQDTCDLVGKGKVITIDVKDQVREKDPRITYLIGDSKDKKIVAKVKEIVGDKPCLVSVDGDHRRASVKWDLHLYKQFVGPGHYLVVEDVYNPPNKPLYGPGEARDWFLKNNSDFQQTDFCKYYQVGFAMDGWLRRNK